MGQEEVLDLLEESPLERYNIHCLSQKTGKNYNSTSRTVHILIRRDEVNYEYVKEHSMGKETVYVWHKPGESN